MYPNSRKPTRPCAIVACAAMVAAFAGCGRSDQEQVRRVAQNYIDSIAKGDYGSACDLLTAAYRRQLGGDAGCARAQLDEFGSGSNRADLEIAGVRVRGSRGNASLNVHRDSAGPSPLSLLLALGSDDRWRIRGQQ